MDTTAAIDVDGLWHHYGGAPVLRDVSFTIGQGELVAVMGPNGMGKSTLLSIIGGAMKPMIGMVRIGGLTRRGSPAEENEIRRRMFWLPAEGFLPFQLTPRNYLYAVGRVYDIPPKRLTEQVERLVAVYDLQDQANALIGHCSTGQRKKIALAGALISDREILVLDEPFSGGLDASGLDATRRILTHLAERQDRTVLMAVPVPSLVEGLAHRIAILDHGNILACEDMAGLRKRTGIDGDLGEIIASLLHADVVGAVEAYVKEGAS